MASHHANAPTPHNAAQAGDFAKTVLMPGDPLRAEFIAKTYLTEPELKTSVRNVLGFTGTYQGVPVSVMATGMGMPSLSIYVTELFDFYGVENIIRVGTAGAIQPNLNVGDLIIAQGACYDSGIMRHYHLPGTYSAIPNWELLLEAVKSAETLNKPYVVGSILSEDTFYNEVHEETFEWQKMGVLALEMEAAALYAIAARRNKRALALLSVSDSLITHEEASSEDRATAFTSMMEVALDVARKFG
ncbi:MAG: purine-nucleoside phosphorylase [Bifidobacteriaceae bacterium]|jgi:purine-nucleoside phosphorylase|nr:purine-nucleoside phosphorylase [Bifidobacteriaceae bacterium]